MEGNEGKFGGWAVQMPTLKGPPKHSQASGGLLSKSMSTKQTPKASNHWTTNQQKKTENVNPPKNTKPQNPKTPKPRY